MVLPMLFYIRKKLSEKGDIPMRISLLLVVLGLVLYLHFYVPV